MCNGWRENFNVSVQRANAHPEPAHDKKAVNT
jgi:hypothetical protein